MQVIEDGPYFSVSGFVTFSYFGAHRPFGLRIIRTCRRPIEVPGCVSGAPFSRVSQEVLAISFLHFPNTSIGFLTRVYK